MAKRAINDGFVDCPKFGIMDQGRCLPSCEFHDAGDENHVTCRYGEEPASAEEQAEAADVKT